MAVIISIPISSKAFKTKFHIYIANGTFFWREDYRLLREFNCRMYIIDRVKKVDPNPLIFLFSNRFPISFLPTPILISNKCFHIPPLLSQISEGLSLFNKGYTLCHVIHLANSLLALPLFKITYFINVT